MNTIEDIDQLIAHAKQRVLQPDQSPIGYNNAVYAYKSLVQLRESLSPTNTADLLAELMIRLGTPESLLDALNAKGWGSPAKGNPCPNAPKPSDSRR